MCHPLLLLPKRTTGAHNDLIRGEEGGVIDCEGIGCQFEIKVIPINPGKHACCPHPKHPISHEIRRARVMGSTGRRVNITLAFDGDSMPLKRCHSSILISAFSYRPYHSGPPILDPPGVCKPPGAAPPALTAPQRPALPAGQSTKGEGTTITEAKGVSHGLSAVRGR